MTVMAALVTIDSPGALLPKRLSGGRSGLMSGRPRKTLKCLNPYYYYYYYYYYLSFSNKQPPVKSDFHVGRLKLTCKYTVFSSGFFCQIYRVTDEALIAETAVRPNFFHMNVFFALKGSKLFIIINHIVLFQTDVVEVYGRIGNTEIYLRGKGPDFPENIHAVLHIDGKQSATEWQLPSDFRITKEIVYVSN